MTPSTPIAGPAPGPLAAELNRRLEKAAPEVLAMLSGLGRRLYFPRGILTQSAEAREGAHRSNATIGIATEGGVPMHLPSVAQHLRDIGPADATEMHPIVETADGIVFLVAGGDAGGFSSLISRWGGGSASSRSITKIGATTR